MKEHTYFSKGLLIVLLFTLAIHLVFLVKNPGNVFNHPERYGEEISLYGSRDASLYAKQAWQLINDGVYGYNSTKSNAYVTPGQPLYLTVIFKVSSWLDINHVTAARVCNLILSVLTTFLVYQISMNLFFKRNIALISAALYATYFSQLHYFRTLLTEVPGIFTMCLALWIFVIAMNENKIKFHIAFGVLFSIAVMFRPTPAPLILLCFAIFIYKYGWKEMIRKSLFWAIGPIIVIFPWVLRNMITLGHAYIFSSHSGNPMLAGTNPFFLEQFNDIGAKRDQLGLTDNEYSLQRIKEGLKKQPDLYISWFTIGKLFWTFRYPSAWHGYLPLYQAWTKLFYLQHFTVVLGGVITGLVFRKDKRVLALSLYVMIFVGILLMFIPDPRFGFYIIPILCVLAAFGIVRLLEKVKLLSAGLLKRI